MHPCVGKLPPGAGIENRCR